MSDTSRHTAALSALHLAYGYCVAATIAAWSRDTLGWLEWLLLLLGALTLLRVAPVIPRTVVPFPESLKREWFERRQLAKQYDSYQWAKLLWIGLGIGGHAVLVGRLWAPEGIVAVLCIGSGALGTWMWYRTRAPITQGAIDGSS